MNVRTYKDPQAIGTAAAALFSAKVIENPHAVLGLATGSTPIPTYTKMAEMYACGAVDFSGVTTYNLDEYVGLGHDHPQSYYYFMMDNLFRHINVPESSIHVLSGTASDSAAECAAYEKAIPKINACADEMTDRRVALMRDRALLDRLYERNEGLYRELCSLIVVGDEAVAQARARGENPQNVARMERRVQDLHVTQVASTQLAAQIRAVQASDETTCSRLQAALEVTIPLWKSQMAAALGLARATDSLTMQRRVGEQAARDVRRGARELAEQTKAYAAADADSDRQRAQQTAESRLAELADIEQSLSEQEKIRRAEQSAERGV